MDFSSTLSRQVGAVLIAPLSFGVAIGFSSPVVADLLSDNRLDVDDRSATLLGSILTLAFLFGALPGGKVLGMVGPRKTVLLSCSQFVVGWMILHYCDDLSMLMVGRIFTGIASGVALVGAPAYISEICTADQRGFYGSSVQLSITIGILMGYTLGAVSTWKMIALIGVGISLLGFALVLGLPPSPYWLVQLGHKDKAREVLRNLRPKDNNLDSELSSMVTRQARSKADWKSIRQALRPLTLSALLMVFQQWNGINSVMYYTEQIFIKAGYEDYSNKAPVIIGVVQVIFTLVSCYLVDQYGRKQLLLTSSILMAISCFALASYYGFDLYDSPNSLKRSLALWSLVVYVLGFSLGWGPVPLLIMAEYFSVEMQGFASAMALSINTLSAFIVTTSYVPLTNEIGEAFIFMIYGISCLLSVGFVSCFLVETKGRTKAQILDYFDTGTKVLPFYQS